MRNSVNESNIDKNDINERDLMKKGNKEGNKEEYRKRSKERDKERG